MKCFYKFATEFKRDMQFPVYNQKVVLALA